MSDRVDGRSAENTQVVILIKRNTLKALLIGAGAAGTAALPEKRIRPSVSSAILPAQAAGTQAQLAECDSPAAVVAGVQAAYIDPDRVGWKIIAPTTEAANSSPVNMEIVSGVEFEGTNNALEFIGQVESGAFAGVPLNSSAESEVSADVGLGRDLEVNFDIGDYGVTDCSFETTIGLD